MKNGYSKIIFVDIETGGLDPFKNPILSIGACVTDVAGNLLEDEPAPLDWKTTGTGMYQKRVAIAGKPEVSNTFYSLINPNPKLEIHPRALEVNGLDLAECRKSPGAKVVLKNFFDWAAEVSAPEPYTFANWALNFDLVFLYVAAQKCGLNFNIPSKYCLDIKSMAKGQGWQFVSLSDMHHQAGTRSLDKNYQGYAAHNALEDAKAAAYVYKFLASSL